MISFVLKIIRSSIIKVKFESRRISQMMTREIYVEKLKSRLDRWNAYLGKLERKAGELEGEVKTSFEEKLKDIRSRRDLVVEKLSQISSAAESAWMSLRRETKEARGKLVDAFSKAHVQISAIIESKHQ
jgi:hypothetical protein